MWTHHVIHRESLDAKELFPELSEVMDTVIRTVNYTKTRPLKGGLLAELNEKMGTEYQALLFYCNSRWLSRGNVVACVYNFPDVALFIEEENLVDAGHFRSEYFISKLAYLSDISEMFSTLNTSMLKNDTNIIAVTDLLGSWARGTENYKGNF
jgi:hypothetical protein